MSGYYSDAPDDEFNEALRAVGVYTPVERFRDTPNGPAPSDPLNGNATARVTREPADHGTDHQTEMARLTESFQQAEPDPVDFRNLTNREYVEQCRKHGYPVPEGATTRAIADPDGKPWGGTDAA